MIIPIIAAIVIFIGIIWFMRSIGSQVVDKILDDREDK